MGLMDGKISSLGQDVSAVSIDLLRGMVDDESELITVFYGQDVSEAMPRRCPSSLLRYSPTAMLRYIRVVNRCTIICFRSSERALPRRRP